jgi:predicted transcriptional regulator
MAVELTLRLDEATITALDDLSRATARSRDAILTDAVRDYVDVQAWQAERIRAGLAAADRGDFVDEQEIARTLARFDQAE